MGTQIPENLYDIVVVGGGPAGLTAALYLARAKYRVIVVEKEKFGGQITITDEVVNYPGVKKTNGAELTETMRKQAQNFGAEFLLADVESLEINGDIKKVKTGRGTLNCFGVLLATGAHPRMVGFQGEAEFRGHGVAYCATCDGEFFIGKEVFVVGGGFAAAEESVFLTKYASHVTILIREDDFTCAESVAEKARTNPSITVLTNTVVERVEGENSLQKIVYKNLKTGKETIYQAKPNDTFGVFVFAGYVPATELVKGIAELDHQGYVLTDSSRKTNIDGLYAAGDVCVKPLRQVVTAVGDGALAATELERYAASMQQKTGFVPQKPKVDSVSSETKPKTSQETSTDSLFSSDMLAQLNTVFGKMQNPLILKLYLDNRPVSDELRHYMESLAELTDMLTVEIGNEDIPDLPCVKVCRDNGTETGLAFHGVPGGHEFTSFVLGIYNASGPGQTIDADIQARISQLNRPTDLRILVSLSCTMCPELVTAAQRIAAVSPYVTAEVYDLNHFQSWKDKYQVMSVPCMVVNNEKVVFGKKNIAQLMDILE